MVVLPFSYIYPYKFVTIFIIFAFRSKENCTILSKLYKKVFLSLLSSLTHLQSSKYPHMFRLTCIHIDRVLMLAIYEMKNCAKNKLIETSRELINRMSMNKMITISIMTLYIHAEAFFQVVLRRKERN